MKFLFNINFVIKCVGSSAKLVVRIFNIAVPRSFHICVKNMRCFGVNFGRIHERNALYRTIKNSTCVHI